MARKKEEIDFSDEDAVLAEMARELDIDVDELEIGDARLPGNVQVYEITVRGGGRKEWNVVEDSDAERELALDLVKQDLDDEPEMFNQDFIESHIDMDRLRRDLESDVQSERHDYYNEMRPKDFWKEAEDFGLDQKWVVTWSTPDDDGTLPGTYASEDDAIDAGEEWRGKQLDSDPEGDENDYSYSTEPADPDHSDIEAVAEKAAESLLEDPMQYLEDIYGKSDAVKRAIEIAGIDIDAAAEDAVNTDGAAHFLSSYDGQTYETKNGLVYWRRN